MAEIHINNEIISDINPLKKPLIAQKAKKSNSPISKTDINYLIS
tara:strand:- start:2127 stop:2258 length:132 start_codon:yes stop_codon:yes gene_type:complete